MANDDFYTARFIHRHYFMPVFARESPMAGSIYIAARRQTALTAPVT